MIEFTHSPRIRYLLGFSCLIHIILNTRDKIVMKMGTALYYGARDQVRAIVTNQEITIVSIKLLL